MDRGTGYVNFHSSVYMKWQLKTLYEHNDPADFSVCIVDNSIPPEKISLKSLVAPYKVQFGNIKIVYADQDHLRSLRHPVYPGSMEHAYGLTLIREECGSPEYILFQDPDFFWLRPGYLDFLEKGLLSGNVAVGAPYNSRMGLGHPRFPALYGCAHRFADIAGLDLFPDMDESKNAALHAADPSLNRRSYDVGWRVRQALSSPEQMNFISFDEYSIDWLHTLSGRHSYSILCKSYYYANQLVAAHLFRGCFTFDVMRSADLTRNQVPTKETVNTPPAKAGGFWIYNSQTIG
jgi:hypothetical protein